MKINKTKELYQILEKANKSFYYYKSNDLLKLSTMALASELIYEDVISNTNYYSTPHYDKLSDYMLNIYKHDFCLVLKTNGNVHPYTRHDVASKCRAEIAHVKKAKQRLQPLKKFMRETEKAAVLFFIGWGSIATPFIQGTGQVTDSSHFFKEHYINEGRQRIELTVAESVILNLYSEIALIAKFGIQAWQENKTIFPFESAYSDKLGEDVCNNIIKQKALWDKYYENSDLFDDVCNVAGGDETAIKDYLNALKLE